MSEGMFVVSLKRSNSKIRGDRADAISDKAKREYKRYVEDREDRIVELKRDREAMLDMSPENTLSLIPASGFDPAKFIEKDMEYSIELRNEEIALEIAKKRYEYLFGYGNKEEAVEPSAKDGE
jgi:hypothetical protein